MALADSVAAACCAGATLYGATLTEKSTVLLGKVAHYSLVYVLPAMKIGWAPALVAGFSYQVAMVRYRRVSSPSTLSLVASGPPRLY